MTHAPMQVTLRLGDPLPEVSDPDRLELRRAASLTVLGLPRAFVRGRRVLQVGGAAESALQFALWGGEVTLLESAPQAIELSERLFLRHRQRLRIEARQPILSDPAAMARFDLIVCEEPLLSSANPTRDLEGLLTNLARGAVAWVSLPEARGWRRRSLMLRITNQIADSSEERVKFARSSFPRHVESTARRRGSDSVTVANELFGGETSRAVDLSEICATFETCDMQYLGSSPTLRSFADGTDVDPFDYAAHARRHSLLEDVWEAFGAGAEAAIAGGFAKFETAIMRELDSLREIERRVARRDVDDALLRALDAGPFIDRFDVVATKG